MRRLYYNCGDPLRVLADQSIRTSGIHSGVSMSSWHELASHGPFKITFREAPWFAKFIRVRYWDPRFRGIVRLGRATDEDGQEFGQEEYERLKREFAAGLPPGCPPHRVWKENFIFRGEREWYSPTGVSFKESDVERVEYMTNAPCIIGPRILKRMKADLAARLGDRYSEISVDDPYLRGG